MKVFILTEGGRKVGFGHITRCLSLFQAIGERVGTPVFLVNGDDSVGYLLKGVNCELFDWLKNRDRFFEKIGGEDVVIIDSYLADISFYTEISKSVKRAVYIDDNKRLDYPRGIVLNGSVLAEEIGYPVKDGVAYLLGTRYTPLRKEFWTVPKMAVNKEPKDVLVTFGGMEYSGFIRKLVDYLKDRFNLVFTVTDDKNRVSTEKMLGLMLDADLCISGGGQTTYELARCGVPTIGICFADNQLNNLSGWAKTGFMEYAGWYNKEDLFKNVEAALTKISGYEKRAAMSHIGQGLIDGQGAKRAAQEILR